MRPPYVTPEALRDLITAALKEDIGSGDITTEATIPEHQFARARMLSKDTGIVAGVEVASIVFQQHDPRLNVSVYRQDGSRIVPGDVVLYVEGPARSLLSAERVALNCIQRMSGIATYTRHLCEILKDTGVQLMDTRKTTPGFRLLEKWAVAVGGGINHRYSLSDMILLKDNHIDIAGGVGEALRKARQIHHGKKIEIETRTLKEVEEVMRENGADVIMLDNMSLDDLSAAVKLIAGRCKTEASGGITPAALLEIAKTGVDYISMGSLTHSYRSLDLSLKVIVRE